MVPASASGLLSGSPGQEAVLLGVGHKFWMQGLEIGGN